MICKQCKEVSEGQFCPSCGSQTEVEQLRQQGCPKCETSCTKKFCPECGEETKNILITVKPISESVGDFAEASAKVIGSYTKPATRMAAKGMIKTCQVGATVAAKTSGWLARFTR